MTVASIFVINYYINENYTKRLERSRVWIGDDATPFSTSLTCATTEPIIEGGFIKLDRIVKGRYVVLRRDGYSLGGIDYTVNEIRVYSVTNLLE